MGGAWCYFFTSGLTVKTKTILLENHYNVQSRVLGKMHRQGLNKKLWKCTREEGDSEWVFLQSHSWVGKEMGGVGE